MRRKNYLILLGLLVLALPGKLLAQTLIPMPAHSSLYTGSARGFWFVAPANFTITGLMVPLEAGTGLQYIQVMKCHDPFPVAFGSQSSNFNNLAYIAGAPSGVIQTVSIPILAGDTIGILGTAGTGNSYSGSLAITTTILGFPVNLQRFGYQGNINVVQAPMYWGEPYASIGQISRVNVYYGTPTPVAPNCIAAPLTPLNNSTTACSGSTLLRWNKSAGATGYDVYFNSGTGTPTTIVSTNQPDTFYNATTVIGPYVWKIVPKNSVGPATGCATFNFTTVAGITPTAVVSVNPNDTICSGLTTVFMAAITNGGTTPVYQWKKNNVNVGTNSPSYTDNALVDGDIVKVQLTSNAVGCLSTPLVTSNSITMTVLPSPVTSVTTIGNTEFCSGGTVTFSATPGATAYQWRQNGVDIAGATNQTFTATYSGSYTVFAASSSNCGAVSQPVIITVHPTPVPIINRIGNDLITASFYTSYQWYRDFVMVPSSGNANIYTFSRDGFYQVYVTDTNGCGGYSAYAPVNSLTVGNTNGAADISIFPNPANSQVYISGIAAANITITNTQGQVVMRREHTNTIDISPLANGVYLLQIADARNVVLKREKLVKTNQ